VKPQLKQRNKMKNKNVGIGFEKVEKFELTEKEGILIRDFLNHYHLEHANCKDKLPLKTQLELLYHYTMTITK